MKHIALRWVSPTLHLVRAYKVLLVGAEVILPSFSSLPLDDLQEAILTYGWDPQDPAHGVRLLEACIHLNGSLQAFPFKVQISSQEWDLNLCSGLVFCCREAGKAQVRVRITDAEKAEAFLTAIYAMNGGVPNIGWVFANEQGKQVLAQFCEKVGAELPSSVSFNNL